MIMKIKALHITIFCLLLSFVIKPMAISGQAVNPYTIQGDEVVFVLDVRRYAETLLSKDADQVDFADLKIHEVAIAGQFNNWNRNGWKMEKKGEFIFELRKKLEAFTDPFPIEFKYIINGKFVSDPNSTNPDSRQFKDDFLEEVYNLDLSVIEVHDRGKVIFRLNGFQSAGEVILTGNFNGWDERAIKMKRDTDGWHLRADLPPGRYEYKFIIDGKWSHDPEAKENVYNEHGTLNSVLKVTVPVTFTLKGFPNARNVILTGSFVEWNEGKLKMSLVNGVWQTTIPLHGGKHHYKYIIDGQWYTDPSNPLVENDGYGNMNSVLFVK